MAQHLPVEILSDDDEEEEPQEAPSLLFNHKKRRSHEVIGPAVVVLDDDLTPKKPSPMVSTPSFVAETPMSSDIFKSDVSIVKCTAGISNPRIGSSSDAAAEKKLAGISGLICLESDNESDSGRERESSKENENLASGFGAVKNSEINSSLLQSDYSPWTDNLRQVLHDRPVHGECSSENAMFQAHSICEEEIDILKHVGNAVKKKDRSVGVNAQKKNHKDETVAGKRKMTEEKRCLVEERKLKREQEKLQKEAMKAEAVKMKKLQKEQEKWEKGKFALKSIVAEIDAKVVELGSIGGHLLTRFAEKGVSFRITSNSIERSILWTMTVPEEISKLSSKGSEIQYLLLVYEADEFCDLVINDSLMDHVSRVRSRYPSYTICYLTNGLMAYINKREQAKYKNPSNNNCWRRPPIEEVLSKLITDFARVHSRLCRDEAELADHVVGLTCSLANCQFRKKLTRLSINANGSLVPKDFVDRNLIKKNVWLKALVAIPKVQPRFAIAIWKKYPTMRSLLSVYMDPNKTLHEKEFLLKDLTVENLLGNEERRVGKVCSKRVYRILMAQNGNIKTDDVEDGADFFRC